MSKTGSTPFDMDSWIEQLNNDNNCSEFGKFATGLVMETVTAEGVCGPETVMRDEEH